MVYKPTNSHIWGAPMAIPYERFWVTSLLVDLGVGNLDVCLTLWRPAVHDLFRGNAWKHLFWWWFAQSIDWFFRENLEEKPHAWW